MLEGDDRLEQVKWLINYCNDSNDSLFDFDSNGIISDTFKINHKGCSPCSNFR